MPTHLANPNDKLQEVIRRGGAVIVAGTGVSMAASRDPSTGKPHPEASWAGLLANGLDWLKQHNHIAADEAAAHLTLLKKRGDTHHFISAAEDVTRLMGGVGSRHFEEWLARTIGSIRAHDRKALDALEALRAHGNLLATTNYDGLLLDGARVLKPVTWKEPDAFLRAARDKETDKVIFLHGYWRQPPSVILDWNSYQEIARDERYREELATVWKMTTWLYVGCGVNGLNDPDFGLLLERYGKRARNAGLWDFCLVRSDQRDKFQAHFDKLQVNICAVSFGTSHDQLPEYLGSLIPAAPSAKAAVAAIGQAPVEPITEFLRVTDTFFQYRVLAVAAGSAASGSRGDFRFTAEEFRSGAVHRAQAVDVALKRLSRDGCVWLEGPSAGGKTTVCLHLVAKWNHYGCEPLYLDLADEPDAEQAAREMTAHAKLGRMFILDNVHDAPKLTCALLDQWRTQRRDSVMVLLGWPAAVRPGHDYLSGHRSAIVTVAVQPEDWIGVYQSTFRQIRGTSHVPPVPPSHAVKEWDDTFSADLVTFQYALAAGLRLGAGNTFQVERAAADRYVREKYLAPCSEMERHDLFLLAWFADLGVGLGEEAIQSKLSRSLGCGLVRNTFHGRLGDHLRFQPWHRSFGRLLLRLSTQAERERGLCESSASHPFCAGPLAVRLCRRGEEELAVKLFEKTLRDHPCLSDWFGDNLLYGVRLLRQTKKLVPSRWNEIVANLGEPQNHSCLQGQAFATPLGDLVTFLRFAGQSTELKPVQESLIKALAADAQLPADKSRLQAQVFTTPLHFLVTFLQFIGQPANHLKPVQESVINALAADAQLPADKSRLQAQVFTTPLHFLVTFLQFIGQSANHLNPVRESVIKALAADARLPADKSRLVRTARTTNYENLRGFMNGVRLIPELASLEQMIERDSECGKVLRVRRESPQLAPAEITNTPQPPTVENMQDLAASIPLKLRSQLEERIQAGIGRVLTEAWETVPTETAQEDRFKTARRKAAEIISRLSPHIKRQVAAHFETQEWEPLKVREPKL